ncbi:MAG TPA: hypothetical protein VGR56_07165 [Nitrososphaerales archaeon]|nr:hypothetical protein [Nitrososphaerales archaeon]
MDPIDFYKQAATVSTFLGGVAFTALVIVLQFPSIVRVGGIFSTPTQHYEDIISVLALACVLLVVASSAMILVGSGIATPSEVVGKIARWSFVGGGLLLIESVPLLIYSSYLLGSLLVFFVGTPLYAYVMITFIRRASKPTP